MAAKKPLLIFVLGSPGSGKGTQCKKIAETSLTLLDLAHPLGHPADEKDRFVVLGKQHFGFEHLSAGELLVEERKSGSKDGDLIENCIVEGKIVPAEITIQLIDKAMQKSPFQKFVLDGFPRNEDNLAGWNRLMGSKVNFKFVLFFECPEGVCLNRILERGKTSGRSDDNINSLVKRFETYKVSTKPIIEHYEKQNLVRKVNGDSYEDESLSQSRDGKTCFLLFMTAWKSKAGTDATSEVFARVTELFEKEGLSRVHLQSNSEGFNDVSIKLAIIITIVSVLLTIFLMNQ